jgi:formamidopyrimidine-DNA glycosylase
MPELPEVETVRRQLSRRLPGLAVRGLHVHDAAVTEPAAPEEVAAAVAGTRVRRLDRRGKFLLVRLDTGDTLGVHLRMTGRLHLHETPPPAGSVRFLRAHLDLGDGSVLTFADQRRFGRIWVLPDGTDEEVHWRGRVGVEPLGTRFTPEVLGDLLRGRRVGVKAALLNQALVAGVGNIYADEALFAARVNPERPAGDLDGDDLARLHAAVRAALEAGLTNGGASIDSYRDALGDPGSMQDVLRIHRREGLPCHGCGDVVVKSRVAQRGTYWCPTCQSR